MDRSVKRILVSCVYITICAAIVLSMMLSVGVDYDITVDADNVKKLVDEELSEETAAILSTLVDNLLYADSQGADGNGETLPMFHMEGDSFFENIADIWNSGKAYFDIFWSGTHSPMISEYPIYVICMGLVAACCWFSAILMVLYTAFIAISIVLMIVMFIAYAVKGKKLTENDKAEVETFNPFDGGALITSIWQAPFWALIMCWLTGFFSNLAFSSLCGVFVTDLPIYVKLVAITPLNHLVVLIVGIILLYVGKAVIYKIYGKPPKKEKKKKVKEA